MVSRIFKTSDNDFILNGQDSQVILSNQSSWQGITPNDISGCIGYWNCNISGTELIDSKGGYNGSTINNPGWINGRIGSGILIGSPAWISIGSNSEFYCGNGLTICGWIYPFNKTDHGCIIGRYKSADSQRSYMIDKYDVSLRFVTSVNGATTSNLSSTNWNINNWYFLTGTFDSGLTIFYINGKFVISGNLVGSLFDSNANLEIGRNFAGEIGSSYLDEIALFNRVLTQEEITQLYNFGYPKFKTYKNTNSNIILKEVT